MNYRENLTLTGKTMTEPIEPQVVQEILSKVYENALRSLDVAPPWEGNSESISDLLEAKPV